MCVVLSQTKNGVSRRRLPLDEVEQRARATSSSIVSIRFLVSGPVSSIRCLPTRPVARVLGVVVLVRRPGVDDAARAEPLVELGEVLGGGQFGCSGSSSAFRW